MVMRIIKNLLSGTWKTRRLFPADTLNAIELAIKNSEHQHTAQLRFVVEHGLDLFPLLRGLTARQRAIEVFSEYRVWDTERNNGVLIYLLLSERDIEIIADRGISAHVPLEEWGRICGTMEKLFRAGEFREGVLSGMAEISKHLVRLYPAGQPSLNELENAPVVL